MHDNHVQARYTGKWTAILFPFLYVAFAVGRADHEDIVTCCIWHPFCLPERPRQIAAGIINLSVAPRLAASEAKFHSRNAAIAAVGDSFYFHRSTQFA